MSKLFGGILAAFGAVNVSLMRVCESVTGIDLSSSCDEFSCLNSDGIDFTITRAWLSYGAFDSSSLTNLENAQSAGIKYNDVYMFPCRGESASTQMSDLVSDLRSSGLWGPLSNDDKIKLSINKKDRENRYKKRYESHVNNKNSIVGKGLQAGYSKVEKAMIKNGISSMSFDINKVIRKKNNNSTFEYNKNKNRKEKVSIPSWRDEATYGMIWLDIEENPSTGCSWSSYSSTSNCEYLGELISAGKDNNATIGIYSSEGEWDNVMGSTDACTDYTSYPLWYAHYDGEKSFSDFSEVSFGGWTSPNIKQYEGDETLCSTGVDLDYYP